MTKRSSREIFDELKLLIEQLLRNEKEQYFDVLYDKMWEIIGSDKEYHNYIPWDVIDADNFLYTYLNNGLVKDWIGLFNEYLLRTEKKDYDAYNLSGYELMNKALEGLVYQLKIGGVKQDVKQKLVSILPKVYEKFGHDIVGGTQTLDERFCNIIRALGWIGSRESIDFLKFQIEWCDRYEHEIGPLNELAEQYYDYSHNVRLLAILALFRIAGEDVIEYVYQRFKKDPSPSICTIIYHSLLKFPAEKVDPVLDKIRESDVFYVWEIEDPSSHDKHYLEEYE